MTKLSSSFSTPFRLTPTLHLLPAQSALTLFSLSLPCFPNLHTGHSTLNLYKCEGMLNSAWKVPGQGIYSVGKLLLLPVLSLFLSFQRVSMTKRVMQGQVPWCSMPYPKGRSREGSGEGQEEGRIRTPSQPLTGGRSHWPAPSLWMEHHATQQAQEEGQVQALCSWLGRQWMDAQGEGWGLVKSIGFLASRCKNTPTGQGWAFRDTYNAGGKH